MAGVYTQPELASFVNDEVKFYRDGRWFVVLDSQKTKHKFALIGAAKK